MRIKYTIILLLYVITYGCAMAQTQNITATDSVTPSVTTSAAGYITTTSAELKGIVNPNGGEQCNVLFSYGNTSSYGNTVGAVPGTVTGLSNVYVTANLTGLIPDTVYHYRTVVNVGGTPYYGTDVVFYTLTTGIAALPAAHELIYPNPAHNQINVALLPGPQPVTLQLRDILGRVIMSRRITPTGTNNTVQFNTNDIARGLYFVVVDYDGTQRATRVSVD